MAVASVLEEAAYSTQVFILCVGDFQEVAAWKFRGDLSTIFYLKEFVVLYRNKTVSLTR